MPASTTERISTAPQCLKTPRPTSRLYAGHRPRPVSLLCVNAQRRTAPLFQIHGPLRYWLSCPRRRTRTCKCPQAGKRVNPISYMATLKTRPSYPPSYWNISYHIAQSEMSQLPSIMAVTEEMGSPIMGFSCRIDRQGQSGRRGTKQPRLQPCPARRVVRLEQGRHLCRIASRAGYRRLTRIRNQKRR
jgi:hypothetical protein